MDSALVTALAWLLAVSSGLLAGTYLAFSSFIMRSLASLGPERAIAAMNAINTTILKSSFMPLFFGSTIIALVMVLAGIWHWGTEGADRIFASGLIYLVGMFVITGVANVPLNNALARVDGDGVSAARDWALFLERWTRWNSVRSGASIATLLICLELLSR